MKRLVDRFNKKVFGDMPMTSEEEKHGEDSGMNKHPHKPGSQHTVAETFANWPFHVVAE